MHHALLGAGVIVARLENVARVEAEPLGAVLAEEPLDDTDPAAVQAETLIGREGKGARFDSGENANIALKFEF